MGTQNPPEPTINRYGLSQVYAPIGGGLVDVVFVHGLNGDPHKTWTSDKNKTFWPYRLLPQALEIPRARILVYGYDADVMSFTDGASKDKIHNHAESLVAALAANRRLRGAAERPIIFVAHSLGGLVVKRALIYSSEIRGNMTEHLRSIYVSAYGILFLGTPHHGSDVATWGSRLEWICGAVLPSGFADSQPQLVDALKTNNETLQNIDRQFMMIMSRFHIFFFHEGKPTKLGPKVHFIVDETSASPNVQDVERASIPADHSHMCKFEDDGSPGYDLVAEAIMRYAMEAPEIIKSRWTAEKSESRAKRQAQIQEIIPGSIAGTPNSDSTSTHTPTPDNSGFLPPQDPPRSDMQHDATKTTPTKPSEPYFIVPPGSRKNTYFVGMEKELQELDRRLFDKRRRSGTATVLLHGQAGGGKSHVARQYIYGENRKKFSGGIFWIPARSREERHQYFWNIKQKVVNREMPDLSDGLSSNDYVSQVKTWFESRQDWLIVFDGVTVDEEKDVTEFADFIPNRKESGIIYVSRAKNLESRERLLRPYPIRVGPLKEEDAKKLLFKELHIKKPTENDKKKAAELVKKIGGLPLAINAISRRLADTHEPLAKYKLSYSRDTALESTYSKIFDDLQRLGHMEAWNLIHILCWFAQDLPVEMVHLGLKILKADNIEVRTTEPGGKPDINTTFGVLMRYALIERNEPDDRGSTSSSRDSLSEPEPIDMLKIHSVVQTFCCDSLNAVGLLAKWLTYAARLFSLSYQEADRKIKQKDEPGRVSDYRCYKVHGQRLLDHTVSYDTRAHPLENIREFLRPTITKIDEEIRQQQPNSSQENLKGGVFQTSIFDRTSSSSENSIPGPTTPNYRPIPPPLIDQNDFGFPKVGLPIDSPGSLNTATPRRHIQIVGSDYGDVGYESDREGPPTSHPMDHNASDMTAGRTTRPRASTIESHNDGEWQTVPSGRKPRKPQKPRRRNLGSFRPVSAGTQVNRQTVTRTEEDKKPHRRESSAALKSLQKAHSQSPSPPRNRIASLFQRGNRPSTARGTHTTQPTWAGVAAGTPGQTAQPGSNLPLEPHTQSGPSPVPMLINRGRSRESLKSRQGNAQPSPLATEFKPGLVPLGYENFRPNPTQSPYSTSAPPIGFQYTAPYPGSTSSLSQIPQGQPINFPTFYNPPPPLGPNRAPLPLDESITVASKRPLPTDLYDHQPLTSTAASPSNHSSPQNRASPFQAVFDPPYPDAVMPAGYYSQPMSRNHSHQSHGSVAETDPIRYPSMYSPQIGPVSDLPRERYPDVQAFRKSPKTGFAMSAHPGTTSSRVSPHDLSHTGGWAPPPPPSGTYDMSMSRSSSGPGVAVQGSPGRPGSIVPFDYSPGSVQFGEHPPISVEEARLRTEDQALKLREQQREREALREIQEERIRQKQAEQHERAREENGARRESAPYPDINLMPTGSDSTALQGMMTSGIRPRGMSAPQNEEPVGLGMRMD